MPPSSRCPPLYTVRQPLWQSMCQRCIHPEGSCLQAVACRRATSTRRHGSIPLPPPAFGLNIWAPASVRIEVVHVALECLGTSKVDAALCAMASSMLHAPSSCLFHRDMVSPPTRPGLLDRLVGHADAPLHSTQHRQKKAAFVNIFVMFLSFIPLGTVFLYYRCFWAGFFFFSSVLSAGAGLAHFLITKRHRVALTIQAWTSTWLSIGCHWAFGPGSSAFMWHWFMSGPAILTSMQLSRTQAAALAAIGVGSLITIQVTDPPLRPPRQLSLAQCAALPRSAVPRCPNSGRGTCLGGCAAHPPSVPHKSAQQPMDPPPFVLADHTCHVVPSQDSQPGNDDQAHAIVETWNLRIKSLQKLNLHDSYVHVHEHHHKQPPPPPLPWASLSGLGCMTLSRDHHRTTLLMMTQRMICVALTGSTCRPPCWGMFTRPVRPVRTTEPWLWLGNLLCLIPCTHDSHVHRTFLMMGTLLSHCAVN